MTDKATKDAQETQNEFLNKAAKELEAEADKRGVVIGAKQRVTEFGTVPYPCILPKNNEPKQQSKNTDSSEESN